MVKRVRQSLMLKWMIFSILLATIPLAIAGFNIIQIYQENLKKSIIELEKEKAKMVVERTEAFFEKITSNLLYLVSDEHFKKGGSSYQIKNLLENVLYQNDYIWELTLLDERGKETIKVSKHRVVGPDDLKNQSRSEMFEVASKGKIYFGEFYLTTDIVPTMGIAVPVEEYKGKPIGVLSAKIHLRYLWNLIPHTQIGKKGMTYVVDKEGNLIAHPDTRQVLLGLNVRHLPMVNQVIAGKEGSLEFEHPQGGKFLGVYNPIIKLGWGVVVQVPVEEAYQPIKQLTQHAVKWILVVLTIAVIVSLFLTRRLTLPIKRLSTEMGEIAKGNLDIHIQPTTRDELGHLTESFNQMIQDLKRSQGALKETEEKYRRIFENLKDMVYITSVDGKFIEINQAGVEMLGYPSKEELMGINVGDAYLSSEDRKRFINEITEVGFVKDFEVKLKRKDGIPIDVLMTSNLRKDKEGHILGYEGVIKNISYRKSIERELLQKTEELQTLHHLSSLLNQSLKLEEILTVALDHIIELSGFEMGRVLILQENGKTLETKFQKGYSSHFLEKASQFDLMEGLAGKAILQKKPLSVETEEHPSPRLRDLMKEEGIQSLVSIPLVAKDRAIGAINLSSRSRWIFTPKEMDLLEHIGNQIGLALENARLFSEVAKAKSEWETTFDAVTDLITIRDKDYRILRANVSAFKRFGLRPEEMIGKRCFETLHQSDQPCEGCYVSKTLETKKPAFGERDSKYLKGIFQYYTFPIYNEGGEVVAVVDLAREITEEKQLEMEKEVVNNINKILASSLDVRQVIKAIHSELKKVFDSERMTIALLGEGGKGFRYFALEKDYDAQELWKDIIYPNEGTPFIEVVEKGYPVIVSDTGESDSWVNQKLFQEGIGSSLVFPLEYKGKVIGTFNFGSKETGHFSETQFNFLSQIAPGLAISIENALLLDEIKASEEKYRTVVEGAHDGICVIGKDNRFKYANKRLVEIQGYAQEELIGMDFLDFLDEGSKQLMTDRFTRWKRGEKLSPRFELNVLRQNGKMRHVEINARVMKDSKGDANFVVFAKDITEKKKMEEQLLQSEKLRALGEMASGVAHDFNNALAAILGNTQLLLYTVKDEEIRESLQTIEKVTKDSAQTVRRLQDFTRKRMHQEFFKLKINSLIKDALEITKPKWKDEAQGRGIHIEVVSNFEEVPPVVGHASELREVIANMIFNAIESMPEGGRIEIRTFQRKNMVYIQISDTGIGMTEEVRNKAFEPFFTTKPFTNTGLGLSMSYGIIKRFGGEIEVESKVGQGATFTIILPIGSEEKEELIAPSSIRKGKEVRILVIDDEESVRDILSKILIQAKHQVVLAENGEEGIRLFSEKEFDLVLTDLGMPGMSGWEVCRIIKRISPHFPVGMITGWGMEVDRAKIEESGLDFIISKPFDFNQILNVVSETVESKGKQFMS